MCMTQAMPMANWSVLLHRPGERIGIIIATMMEQTIQKPRKPLACLIRSGVKDLHTFGEVIIRESRLMEPKLLHLVMNSISQEQIHCGNIRVNKHALITMACPWSLKI